MKKKDNGIDKFHEILDDISIEHPDLSAGTLIFALVFAVGLVLLLSYLGTAALVWVVCWALGLLGIGIQFTWAKALGIWVLWTIATYVFRSFTTRDSED